MENKKRESTNSRRSAEKELAAFLRQDILDKTPFALGSHPEFGVFLVAKRDIEAGEVLYEDKAAIGGPCANIPDVEYETPLCLGCCVLMEEEKVREHRCDSCGWPICSLECEGLDNHTKNECQVFREFGTTFPPDTGIASCYAVIQVIRGLLLKVNNPDMWSLIMTLQWKSQLEYKSSLNIPSLKECYGLPSDFGSDEEWIRIYGIVSVNNHTTTLPVCHGSNLIRCGEALFPLYSLVANSCSPNCVWALKYDDKNTHSFTLAMYPAVDIKKGEMLTAAYISSLTKLGNHKRRRKLRERMKFRCMCLRCQDPTELGSYFDALKCFQCKDGYMLPIMAEDDGDADSYWICELCHYSVPLLFGCSLLELVFEKLLSTGEKAKSNGVSLVEQLEFFIETYSGVYLHPNHCILAEAAYVIVQIQMGKIELEEPISVEELERYLELCYYLLAIGNKLAPGLSVERGMVFYYIARGLFRKLELQLNLSSVVTAAAEAADTDQAIEEVEDGGGSGGGANAENVGDGNHNLDIKLKDDIKKLEDVQKEALRFWQENPRRYIFSKDEMVKVERLRKEVDIFTQFKKIDSVNQLLLVKL